MPTVKARFDQSGHIDGDFGTMRENMIEIMCASLQGFVTLGEAARGAIVRMVAMKTGRHEGRRAPWGGKEAPGGCGAQPHPVLTDNHCRARRPLSLPMHPRIPRVGLGRWLSRHSLPPHSLMRSQGERAGRRRENGPHRALSSSTRSHPPAPDARCPDPAWTRLNTLRQVQMKLARRGA